MAADYRIPTRRRRGNISSFRVLSPNKGLNTIVPDTDITELESPALNNIDYVETGNPSTRKGRVQYCNIDPDGAADGMFPFYRHQSSTHLLRLSGTSLKTINEITGAITTITGKTFTADRVTMGVVADGAIKILNGTDIAGSFDGTTLSTPSTQLPLAFGIWHKGYFIGGGHPNHPNRLYWSDINKPDDFTEGAASSAGTQNIDKDDGDRLTGIGLWGDTIVLFKERAIYQIDISTIATTKAVSVKNIIKGIGCVSHRTIRPVDNDLFYLSRGGVYVIGNEANFLSAIRTNELSLRARKVIDQITPSNYNRCHAEYVDFKYILSVPLGGVVGNSHLIIYDKKYQAWTVWSNQTFADLVRYIDRNNAEILLAADSVNGKTYQLFQSETDDGAAIDCYWYSKRYNLKSFDEFKRWFDVTLLFRSVTGVISIDIIVDNFIISKKVYIGNVNALASGIGVKEWGLVEVGTDGVTSEVGAPETIVDIVKRIKVNRPGRAIQIKVSTNSVNDRFVLTGYNVTYYNYGHFKFPSSDKL